MAPADHKKQLARLNRIAGQIQGIKKMIEDGRYCIDILSQTKAAGAALRQVEIAILQNHISHCVKHAVQTQNETELQTKLDEMLTLLQARF